MIDFKLFLWGRQFVSISDMVIPNAKLILSSSQKKKTKLALSLLTVRLLIKPYMGMFSST